MRDSGGDAVQAVYRRQSTAYRNTCGHPRPRGESMVLTRK